jgi:hypothetical protein
MPLSFNQYKLNKSAKSGFILFLPLLVFSLASLSSVYLLIYKVETFRYAITRNEEFIKQKYAKKSCENLGELYRSYDPDFVIKC